MKKARIFEIKRFAVHDGDGIRTTVFLKGCPLKCVWCHNPEGISFRPQLAYYLGKCIGCEECVTACTQNAHTFDNGLHVFDRNLCSACGKCEDACLGQAVKCYGSEMSIEELLPSLLEDKAFYDNSGGGVTLSGGECLMQADFCAELLKELKNMNIHTAVDTCGFVPRENIDKVIPYTDIFLYDLKAFDEEVHVKCTGMPNKLILDNLCYLDRQDKQIEIRIPFVPGYNDDQIDKLGLFLSGLQNLTKVRLLPYHNYAGSKYMSLEMENTLPEKLPTKDEVEAARKCLKKYLGVERVD